jgi:hypothetical protein
VINRLPFSEENYIKTKEDARKLYSSFGSIKCDALGGQSVYFTSEGFNHLIYKNKRERSKNDQFMRLKVLDLAKRILDITTTYQEYEEVLQNILVKVKKHKEYSSIPVKYWGFIAIIENKKLRVVVKQIRGGRLQFWSVAPFWRTTKHGDIKFMEYTSDDMENS